MNLDVLKPTWLNFHWLSEPAACQREMNSGKWGWNWHTHKKYNKDAVSCGQRLKLFSTSVKKAMLSDISDIPLTPGWRLGNVPRSGYFSADPGVYSCSYLNWSNLARVFIVCKWRVCILVQIQMLISLLRVSFIERPPFDDCAGLVKVWTVQAFLLTGPWFKKQDITC